MTIKFLHKISYKLLFFGRLFLYFFIPNLNVLFFKKISFSKIPTFNIPTKIRGKGKIEIGQKCVFGSKMGGFYKNGSVEFIARGENSKIVLGEGIWTNNNISIICQNFINIGSGCLLGQNVLIMDFEAHSINPDRRKELGEVGTVEIGKNVWVGSNVIILKNSKIGDNSIIAAGAVVTGEFPENVIIGGVPAKIIKVIDLC